MSWLLLLCTVAVVAQSHSRRRTLQALRAALRPRCHVREPQLLVLLRELLRCGVAADATAVVLPRWLAHANAQDSI